MALRLGDFVLRGEIINTDRYSTHGYLELRGHDRPLVLQLTGDCSADLAGQHVRFEVRGADEIDAVDAAGDEAGAFEPFHAEGLAWQQVGPTGEITAARTVKVLSGPPQDDYDAVRSGESPPFEWKRCLYLEWYGQNGRVVVELADPILEFVEQDEEFDPGLPDPDDLVDDPFDLSDADAGDATIPGDDEPDFGPARPPIDEGDDDPYGLFPEGFESQFESRAAETDRFIGSSRSETDDTLSEVELLDNLIENGEGDPIGTIFDTPFKIRRPDGLDDAAVEAELKVLLAQLALYGIAIDVCEHYDPRQTYSWLLDEILPKESAYPELRDTQWVQHFSTSDDCPDCDAEFEIEFEERDVDLDLDDDDDLDDDVPF
jgi:hypothetical protein